VKKAIEMEAIRKEGELMGITVSPVHRFSTLDPEFDISIYE
jgi:hypothetical protein